MSTVGRRARDAHRAPVSGASGRGVGAGEDAAQTLEWAARLHEIGLAIAHSRYHRHGAYLTRHSDLPGFSWQEQRLSAVLIRGHRRRFPEATFEKLPKKEARAAPALCCCCGSRCCCTADGWTGVAGVPARGRQAAVAVALSARLVGETPADARRFGAGGRVSARAEVATPVYLIKNKEGGGAPQAVRRAFAATRPAPKSAPAGRRD